jgi:geranylgeranyl diphosphate synthase type II
MGGICGGASPASLAALTQYGDCAGLAFQIADDILNVTSTAKQLGKPVGNDEHLKKLTYVAVHGLEASRQKAQALISQAIESIRSLPGDPTPLIALAEFTVKRAW